MRTKLLKPIKEFEEIENKQPFKDFPEFAHTESVFELCEAISLHNSSVKSDKIEKAFNAIKVTLESEPKSELYRSTEKRIDKWRRDINRSEKRI